jgi:ADP-ribose pyrophosphatase
MTTQILQKVQAFTGKVFSVIQFTMRLPDGKVRTYDQVHLQNAVTILPIDEEDQVYFVRQYRIGSESELLELPAGKVEEGEDPLLTAGRELREETGMAARELKPLGNFYMSPGYADEYMYCFLATGLYPDALAPDVDEFLNVEKIPLTKVYEMIENGLIEDSKTLASLMLARKLL